MTAGLSFPSGPALIERRYNCAGSRPALQQNRRFNCRCDAVLVIREGQVPAIGLKARAVVRHHERMGCELKHFEIVVIVADRHDFAFRDPAMARPALERRALGTAEGHDIEQGNVPRQILGP